MRVPGSTARRFGVGGVSVALALLLAACGPSAKSGDGNNNNEGGCGAGLTECNGQCVNLLSDVLHCGSCNAPCMPPAVCDGSGNCTSDCQPGLTNCGGECVDTNWNVFHCNGCFLPCGPDEICEGGACSDGSCTETSSEAESGALPADIIVVVDNSGSMTDEAASVQASMNDLASIIGSSGIDYHVILISSGSDDEQGVCVPPPLGSGACPNDENLPTFRHVMQDVASSNSLELILSTYPQWSGNLRPNGSRTITVITDDNSALDANSFMTQLVALDPSFAGFKFHGIFAPYEVNPMVCMMCSTSGTCGTPSCDTCCGVDSSLGLMCTPLPADEGTVYRDLVNLTGGIEGDLCVQDFIPAFQAMATEVVADSLVACVYNIPDPPGGEEIDYGRVNVAYQPTPGANPIDIYYVPGGATDCGPAGGWYYDDPTNPTQLLFCPTTCDLVQSSTTGSVAVKFGCATVVQ